MVCLAWSGWLCVAASGSHFGVETPKWRPGVTGGSAHPAHPAPALGAAGRLQPERDGRQPAPLRLLRHYNICYEAVITFVTDDYGAERRASPAFDGRRTGCPVAGVSAHFSVGCQRCRGLKYALI